MNLSSNTKSTTMKQLDPLDAIHRNLPKWPQALVTSVDGSNLLEDQAKDVIFRTDSLFTQPSDHHGNNRSWVAWANGVLGYDKILEIDDWQVQWKITEKLAEEFKFVRNEYLHNTWAASCFIHGPYGWCSPGGEICYYDNIGKYPSVEEVANELKKIGANFPYVNMYVTLMNGEQCEENIEPIVTMKLENSLVSFYEGTIAPHQHMRKMKRADEDYINFFNKTEQGLPNQWIYDFGHQTRPVVERILKNIE